MLEVTPNTAIMLYLGLSLGTLLAIWVVQHYYRRKNKVVTTDQKLLLCEYCQCAYVEDLSKDVTRCPMCHSFNKNNKYQA